MIADEELDPLLQSMQGNKLLSTAKTSKIKIRRHSVKPALSGADSAESDDIDVLINILQDPDTGAPRPSATALQEHVRLRTGNS